MGSTRKLLVGPAYFVAMAQRFVNDRDGDSTSKIPPSWDGVSKSMEQYFEEIEDWLGYTELVDKPMRIGPAIKARLSGKPKLISKSLTIAEIQQVETQAQGDTPAGEAGYRVLLALLKEKLQDEDADHKWKEIQRFQRLQKQPNESYREFIAMFEVAMARANSSGYNLSGEGPTFALFDAVKISPHQKALVLTHTQGCLDFDQVVRAMKRVLDLAESSAPKDNDELRNRNSRPPSGPMGYNPQASRAYFTEAGETEEPCQDFGESEYEVSEDERDEFVQLFTQKQAVNKSLRKFKRPYRPTQPKKRWMQASANAAGPEPPSGPRRMFYLNEDGTYEECTATYFASFAKPSSGQPAQGKNPIDRKTGERMTCNKCNSPDHFERDCRASGKSNHVRFMESEHESSPVITSFVVNEEKAEESEEELTEMELVL